MIVVLPTLLYDVIKHNFLSNICNSTVRDLTDALLSLILCQICSFISRLSKFSRILMKLFHITSIFQMTWLFDSCTLSLSTVSSACLLVLLWSTEGWRPMTTKKERRMWCTVHCIAFSILHSLSSFMRTSL